MFHAFMVMNPLNTLKMQETLLCQQHQKNVQVFKSVITNATAYPSLKIKCIIGLNKDVPLKEIKSALKKIELALKEIELPLKEIELSLMEIELALMEIRYF